jgi:DnaK suppressor protein
VDPQHAAELLARERARIERSLAELDRQNGDSELADVDQHLADAGSDLFDKERDAGLIEQLRDQLAAVERAEKRLAEGKYGLSIESGEPIPDARLEAVPYAERTVEEQSRYERGI